MFCHTLCEHDFCTDDTVIGWCREKTCQLRTGFHGTAMGLMFLGFHVLLDIIKSTMADAEVSTADLTKCMRIPKCWGSNYWVVFWVFHSEFLQCALFLWHLLSCQSLLLSLTNLNATSAWSGTRSHHAALPRSSVNDVNLVAMAIIGRIIYHVPQGRPQR